MGLDKEELKKFIEVGAETIHTAASRTRWHLPDTPQVVAYAPLNLVDPPYLCDGDFEEGGWVEFPEPQGIQINMLPFIMGAKDTLPEEFHHYWPMIEACELPETEIGKVGYLTIHESLVRKGESQRRPGVHIETPGLVLGAEGKYHQHPAMWGCGLVEASRKEFPNLPRVVGGLYMASNVQSSCNVWNTLITDPGIVVGHHGDLEHVRDILGNPTPMRANQIYWLTDRTPHESLPLKEEQHRQFFRLVTSSLSVWFPEHSTANRLGTVPDPSVTTLVEKNKFAEP